MEKTISNFMSPHVHTIGADQSLESAKKIMYSHNIKHLPVLKGGHLYGIISDRDVKLAYAVDGNVAKDLKVEDACTTDVYFASKNDSLKSIAQEMAIRGIGCCVIASNGTVEGIFTVTDACRILGELLP